MFWAVTHSKLIFTVFTSTHFDSWEHQALQTILRQQIPLTALLLQTKVKVCASKCNFQYCCSINGTAMNSPLFCFFILFGRGHWNRPSSREKSREKISRKIRSQALSVCHPCTFFSECHWKVNHSFQFHCCHFMLSSLDSSACALTSLVEKWVQKPLRLVSRGWYYSPTHLSRLFLSLSYITQPLTFIHAMSLSWPVFLKAPNVFTISSQVTFISIMHITTTNVGCRRNHIWFKICVFSTVLY